MELYSLPYFIISWWEENIHSPGIENEVKRRQSGYCSTQGTPSHFEWGCLSLAIFLDPQIIRLVFQRSQIIKRLNT